MLTGSVRRLRRLLDPWSVPHFLFGATMALAAITFVWPLFITFVATLIAAVLWEYFERYAAIREASGNPWMDVILPALAFGLTLPLVDQAPLQEEHHLALFVSVLLLFAFTNAAAWRARLQRDRDFLG